jgi:hypothetical protein
VANTIKSGVWAGCTYPEVRRRQKAMNATHKLIIHSLHDANLTCSCDTWGFSSTGKITREKAEKEFNEHLKNCGIGTQHTPTPWAVFQLADDEDTYGIDAGKWIVTTDEHRNEVTGVIQTLEDARLIAASPEMLVSLQHLVEQLEWHIKNNNDFGADRQRVREAQAVIAKAQGKDS